MVQAPRFGTHVIHRFIQKCNYHRVKVYHLQVFCLASLHIQAILNHLNERTRIVFCAQPLLHTHAKNHVISPARHARTVKHSTSTMQPVRYHYKTISQTYGKNNAQFKYVYYNVCNSCQPISEWNNKTWQFYVFYIKCIFTFILNTHCIFESCSKTLNILINYQNKN